MHTGKEDNRFVFFPAHQLFEQLLFIFSKPFNILMLFFRFHLEFTFIIPQTKKRLPGFKLVTLSNSSILKLVILSNPSSFKLVILSNPSSFKLVILSNPSSFKLVILFKSS